MICKHVLACQLLGFTCSVFGLRIVRDGVSPAARGRRRVQAADATPPTAKADPDLETEPGARATPQGAGSTNPHGEPGKRVEHRKRSNPALSF